MTLPFHGGELEAQARAGVGEAAAAGGAFIRDHMPEQHRAFFAGLPFLVVAGGDAQGRTWASILEGPEGFATSPDPRRLNLGRGLAPADPLAETFERGGEIGLLGIELATRRRNRLNGRLRREGEGEGFALEVWQSFGNCPQHILPRERRVEGGRPGPVRVSDRLSGEQAARISAADTFFIASGFAASGREDGAAGGFDASHRGGPQGFVRVEGGGALSFPDYAGNNFFNTLGNLLRDPRVGLVFVDFESGGLLHLSGRASIDWRPGASADPDARRLVRVAIERVIERPGALSLRWRREGAARLRLRVTRKVRESAGIVSFHLAPQDGSPPPAFRPGQHLPVALEIPGRPGRVRRSYSLSGPGPGLRISVKREGRGLASRFLHDAVAVGDVIEADLPAGEFALPGGDAPLVMAGAGVGVTPLLAMLHAAAAGDPGRPVRFAQGVRSGRDHAFKAEVAGLAGPARVARVWFSAPDAQDRRAGGFDAEGRLSAADLLALAPSQDAEFLLCGPAAFLAQIRAGLEAGGVPASRIHVESFGPEG
ncbi:pyridoxamine 5'-phosphate oxidase family protein [uncultured Albimonas sp.]|uniref:pyridoxamine 5'-phosphate oxidase family protein n=1 Tax=uncultured Albimonas sp. TaxID=1331701 RepID=UPI0030EE831A